MSHSSSSVVRINENIRVTLAVVLTRAAIHGYNVQGLVELTGAGSVSNHPKLVTVAWQLTILTCPITSHMNTSSNLFLVT